MVSGSVNSINIEYFFRLIYDVFTLSHIPRGTHALLMLIWQIVAVIGYTLSLIALFILVYAFMRLKDVRRQEAVIYGPLPVPDESNVSDPRWKHVQDLMESQNTNDWRQAIIEADIMLSDILTQQRYQGETIGEQLQQVEPSDFSTLQDAWDAHKVRNQIAHRGSSFILSETLAARTIAQYENVFQEFALI